MLASRESEFNSPSQPFVQLRNWNISVQSFGFGYITRVLSWNFEGVLPGGRLVFAAEPSVRRARGCRWEPYGYIKYNPNDVDNIIINEVEYIKQITEDIKLPKDLTLTIPTNIILNKLIDSNITGIIFDFVGHISQVFKILPNKIYNEHKAKTINLNKYIINTNQDITPTIHNSDGDITNIDLTNCNVDICKEQGDILYM